jgi:hypothetical protein
MSPHSDPDQRLSPTEAQREQFAQVQGQVVLAQFLAVKDGGAFHPYSTFSHNAVAEKNGGRLYAVHIDQILAGGAMPYDTLLVDQFPSVTAALAAFDALQGRLAAAVSQAYIIVVKREAPLILKLIRPLRFLQPLFSRLKGTTSEKQLPPMENANPATGPIPETIAQLRQGDQTTPFYMMNLNRYYTKARYEHGEELSGVEAYGRYGKKVAPYLISVGGYPDFMGHVIGTLVGDENSPLHEAWDEFAMVYYPSRKAFLRMMTNLAGEGAPNRDAGLKRAVLMPSTDFSLTR